MMKVLVHSLSVVALLGTSCATLHSRPPSAPFRVTTSAPDATVWVDDRLAGPAPAFSKGDKLLPIGFHRIEVRAPGYYSLFREIEVKEGQSVAIDAPLHPELDE